MSVASDYAEAIVRRAREPMEPLEFLPDWADQPFRHKVYRDVVRLPLPSGTPAAGPGLGDCLAGPAPGAAGSFTLESLAAMLQHAYGLLGRRLRVNGNDDNDNRPWLRTATWSRGAASGGGLYPCEIYWISGPSGPLVPGVYHYSTPHHALQRLLAGDVTGLLQDALPGHAEARLTDQFLLVTVRFWKNAFKYNTFCYHVVTMDLGALLETWQLWCQAAGVNARPAFWFDDQSLNRLLGLETTDESVMAVVPVPWAAAAPVPAAPVPAPARPGRGDAATPARGDAAAWPPPSVVKHHIERSRTVIRFPRITQVHQATLLDRTRLTRVPGPAALAPAAVEVPARSRGVRLPRPEAGLLDKSLVRVLRARRSSFGLFSGQPPLSQAELGALLSAGGHGRHLRSELRASDGAPPLTRLAVFVNHVEGIAPGAYDYDPQRWLLGLIPGDPISPFLQHQYFLHNYNLEQSAAVLAVVTRPAAVISAIGDRGYRVVNAEVGAVAQAVYLAAAAMGLGCGAALGFDNVAIAERLALEARDERPVLLILLGRERAGQADFQARLA